MPFQIDESFNGRILNRTVACIFLNCTTRTVVFNVYVIQNR